MQQHSDPKLTAQLGDWYRDMHGRGDFQGRVQDHHLAALAALCGTDFPRGRRVLDFGCGPHGGLRQAWGEAVRGYDPYVPAYAGPPWAQAYDLVYSTDVLEHLPLEGLQYFVKRVKSAGPAFVYAAVSTRPARKCFPNGLNVHLTVETPDWWRGLFQGGWPAHELRRARADPLACEAVFGFARKV